MVKHIVLMQFKPGTPDAKIRQIRDAVAGLKQQVPGIADFAWGEYSSPEGFNKGFTHAFITTFETMTARDAYLPHPEHDRVKDLLLAHTADVLAFDFEA